MNTPPGFQQFLDFNAMLNSLKSMVNTISQLAQAAGRGQAGAGGVLQSFLRLGFGLGPLSPLMAQIRAFFQLSQAAGKASGISPPLAAGIMQLGRFAIAMHVLYEGLELITRATIAAAAATVEWAQGIARTGGNAFAFSATKGMLAPAGISDAAGFARAFRDRIASEPMAMIEAGRFGMRAFPRGFGMNGPGDAALLLKEISTIRGFRTEMEALNHAMKLGTEDLLIWRKATADQVLMAKTLGAVMAAVRGPAQQAAAARLSVELANFTTQWEIFKTSFLAGVIPMATGFLKLANLANLPWTMLLGGISALQNPLHPLGEGHEALRSNTAAVNNNTRALGRAARVWGGPAAQHAVPAGLRGMSLQAAMANGTAAGLGQIRY
jgi:hypothetical protein